MIRGRITGATSMIIGNPDTKILSKHIRKIIRIFSGKNAGICYMKTSYNDINKESEETSINRFAATTKMNHHSISEHFKITILFEEISKIQAMIMNSLSDYCTSEKSGRYTDMSNYCSKEEKILYDKWFNIIKNIVLEKDLANDESHAEKLAMENARYFLSVFNKATTMSYTTSIRQWNYIYRWCLRFDPNTDDVNNFDYKIKQELLEIANIISEAGIVFKDMDDIKNRNIPFLAKQNKNMILYTGKEKSYNTNYCTNFDISFVALADIERHRTLKYYMVFDNDDAKIIGTNSFFVPYIFQDNIELKTEWVDDMMSIKHLVPQGTKIHVIETGELCNFLLKCRERVCGRPQVEVLKLTINTLTEYYDNYLSGILNDPETPEWLISELNNYISSDGKIKPKCVMNGTCKEKCRYVKDLMSKQI